MTKLNAAFWKWFGSSVITNDDGSPMIVYHGTDKSFTKFSLKNSTQGVIWFTSDRSKIERGEAGASGRGRILSLCVRMERPAGWPEYEKLFLGQIKQEFDGVILADKSGEFDGFVFSPNQIKIVAVES